MSYSIGQVIYVLSSKTQTVLPGIVREEIHHRSLDGENVSYKIAIGPQNKQRIVDLSNVDGEVYGSIDEVRNILISRLTSFVDELCETTIDRVNVWYGQSNKNHSAPSSSSERLDPSVLLNEMGQQSYASPIPQQSVKNVNSLRSALSDPELNTREIVMEDGTIRKVSINIPQG